MPLGPPSTTWNGCSASQLPAVHTKYHQQALGRICNFFKKINNTEQKKTARNFFCLVPSKQAQAAQLGQLVGGPLLGWRYGGDGHQVCLIACVVDALLLQHQPLVSPFPDHKKNPVQLLQARRVSGNLPLHIPQW